MKNICLSVVALTFFGSALAQDAAVDQTSLSVLQELRSLPSRSVSFGRKLLNFEKAIDYLKGARNCLSGIGCSKRQSYLANFLLGAAFGFLNTPAALLAMEKREPEFKNHVIWLNLLVQELGYRYVVKDSVSLFRCLTFRGCTDQTKRYAFFWLGNISGMIGPILAMRGFEKVQKTPLKRVPQSRASGRRRASRSRKIRNRTSARRRTGSEEQLQTPVLHPGERVSSADLEEPKERAVRRTRSEEQLQIFRQLDAAEKEYREEKQQFNNALNEYKKKMGESYDTEEFTQEGKRKIIQLRKLDLQSFIDAYNEYKDAIQSMLELLIDESDKKQFRKELNELQADAIEYLKGQNIYQDPQVIPSD